MTFTPNPALDLVLERTIAVSPERVWAAWTQPELLMQWFTPAPWKTVAADLDVRPGGRFATTMESPEGEQQLRLAPMPGKQGFGKLQPGARIAGLQQRICPHQLRIPFAPQRGGQQFRGIVAEPRARQAGGIGSQQCRMLSSRRG